MSASTTGPTAQAPEAACLPAAAFPEKPPSLRRLSVSGTQLWIAFTLLVGLLAAPLTFLLLIWVSLLLEL